MPVQNIINYFKSAKDITAVYLFGSYAGGKQTACSDIDLAVLFDGLERKAVSQRLDKYLVELSRILRKDIHLTAMNFASEMLLKQIFKKGTLLVVNDPNKLARFTMTAYSKIAAFQYHHRQMQTAMVRKIMEGV